MTVHKSEQLIVDILSQVLPLDVIKYEILPRYRLPTDEEVVKGKRLFNRCLVELGYICCTRVYRGGDFPSVPKQIIHGITEGQNNDYMLYRMPYEMLTKGFSEEILQTLKPSEVGGDFFAAGDAGFYKWRMIRQITMSSLEGVVKSKLNFIQREVIPEWNGWAFDDPVEITTDD